MLTRTATPAPDTLFACAIDLPEVRLEVDYGSAVRGAWIGPHPATAARQGRDMAKLVFGMNQSLDGVVDHDAFGPGPVLFRHFIDLARGLTGSLYGRGLYDLMRYWDDEDPNWDAPEREFAEAWRRQPKWVASNSLTAVGPNATLIKGDLESAVRQLKADHDGEIDVGGPVLAKSLTELGLIDEYRIYLHPVVIGQGAPFFRAPPPPLRLVGHERVGEEVILLTYVPA